ncbi:VOC family protein [Amorphoplanes nipponensis]|uniref:VOC family protein n=1 Tax=Actinoplanes nipponensis TaxID=135950 RepID=A0A919MR23_9ACTN|nr:VOC family protein [Actinoplanes nipponensis]GIE54231.1 VOC family protein [Actinoplanes nipponensis]
MTVLLNPYLTFGDGQARAAMEFYHSVLGGQLDVSTFGDFGAPDPALADKVMHAMLVTDGGLALMASDTAPGMEHVHGTDIAISLSGDEAETLRGWFERLAEGGTIGMPLEKQMWGDEFGTCTDRFGVQWMVNIGAPRS